VNNTPGACTATVTLTAPATADNCNVSTVTNDHASTTYPVGTTTVIWTVTDIHGNSNTCAQTVTVTDNELPTITCASNVSVNNTPGACTATVTLVDPTTGDNCGVSTVTNNHASTTYPVGTTTVIWTVTDIHGNSATCAQTVTVTDNEVPSITCASNVSVNNTPGLCQATVTLTSPTTADNCNVSTVTNDHASTTYPVGTTTVIWTVTDIHGNSNTCAQTVTVTDNEAPVVTTASGSLNHTLECSDASGITSALAEAPSATDNCTTPTIHLVSDNTTPDANCANAYVRTRVWNFTDAVGNTSANFTQVITVRDITAPVITSSPANATVSCSADTAVNLDLVVATDNCTTTVIKSYSDVVSNKTCDNKFTLTRTFTVSDGCGNTTTAQQVITVNDITKPSLTPPATQYLNIGATANCRINMPDFRGLVTATDNCGGAVTLTQLSPNQIGALIIGYGSPRTVKIAAVDACGNKDTTQFTVIIVDSTPPVITCPAALTVGTNTGCTYVGAIGTATATDACATPVVTSNKPAVFPLGETIVTWTATDNAGNTSTCTQVITVVDDDAPSITCVGNQTKNTDAGVCTYTVIGNEFDPTASGDNCTVASVLNNYNSSSTLASAVFPKGTTTVIWTVTDATGNTTTCSYTVTVNDNENPTITAASNVSVNTDADVCTATIAINNAVFNDNCPESAVAYTMSGATTSSSTSGQVGTYTFNKGVTTILYTVTDASGHTATSSMTVTVEDHQAPSITCVAAQTRNSDAGLCNYTTVASEFNPVAYDDNCSGSTILNNYNNTNTLAGAVFPVGTTNVIWTVTDASGNTTTCNFNVVIEDNELPTITCAADVSVNNITGTCEATVTLSTPTTADNCGVSTVTSDHPSTTYPVGTTTVIWTVTDIHGNTATCAQTVTVTDNELPSITCIAAPTRSTDADACTYTVQGTEFNPVTTADNCAVSTVLNNYNSSSSLAGAVFPKGTTTVIWTVTDIHGNSTSCSYVVTVNDTQAPAISCAADQTRNTDNGVCTYTTVDNEFDPASFDDNCTGSTITNNYNSSNTLAGAVFPKGTTTVIWTVTDASGNTTTCSNTITVNDNQQPVITYCSADQDVNAAINSCTYTVSGTSWDATATDNCTVSSLTYSLEGATAGTGTSLNGQAFNLGTTTVTWTATDGSTTAVVCSYNVNVTDVTAPVITCPNDTTIAKDRSCESVIPDFTHSVTVYDNCGIALIEQDIPEGTTVSGSIASLPIVITVTDNSGNTSTCSFNVTFSDITPPDFVNPPTDVVVFNTSGSCSQTATWNPPTLVDNCEYLVKPTLTVTHEPGSTFPLGVTTVTYTATDESGNSSTYAFTVTVLDTVRPSVTTMANVSVTTSSDGTGDCTAAVNITNASTNDNCSVSILTWTLSGATNASSAETGINQIGTYTFNLGVTTIKYTVTDGSGNTSSAQMTVTVTDNENPVVTPVSDITTTTSSDGTGNCTADIAVGDATTSDNCSVAKLVWTLSGATTGNSPATGINQIGTRNFNVGVTTITYTITDGSGNTTTSSMTVTVTDDELPSITCAAPVAVNNTTGACQATVILQIPATADNCGVSTVVSDHPSSIYPVGETVVTWTVTDVHGNTSTCTQTVTVTDNEAPSITCASNVSVFNASGLCEASVTLVAPATDDNCGVSVVENNHPSPIYPVGTTTVIWTVTDIHGNSSTCAQTVTVTDNEVPSITCAAPVTVNNTTGLCEATVILTVPTTADNCGVSNVVSDHPSTTYPVGTTTVLWTVTDIHGNTNTCTQTVTVNDVELPTITCAADVLVNNNTDACEATVTLTSPVTADNCAVSTVTNNHPSTSYPVGTTTVIWTVTDIHGNSNTCAQTVTVTDNQSPDIAGCPADMTIYTGVNSTTCGSVVNWTAPTASDNCTISTFTSNYNSGDTFPVGTTTVTYTATDIHNNTSVCSFTVTVIDNTIPAINECPVNITVYSQSANPATCGQVATWTAPTASDNCGLSGSLTSSHNPGDTFPVGSTIVTYTAEDIHGNIATSSFYVTVIDNTLPTITCAAPVTVVNATGSCSATVVLDAPVTADNCAVSVVTNDHPSTTFTVGTTTVVWTVTDVNGNTATCAQTVTVNDTEAPSITCASDVTVNNDAGLCSATVTLNAPATDDNCAVSTVTNDHPSTTFTVGTTTVIWTVTDVHGNSSTCAQTVTVNDTEAPVVTCAAPVTVSNITGTCEATVTLTAPTTSDNCAVSNVTNDHPSTTYPVGTTTVIWTVTDVHGNTSTCAQTVTVNDTELPEFTYCPSPVVNATVNASGCAATVATVQPVASDNCGVSTLTWSLTGATTASSAATGINYLPNPYNFNAGTTTVTYTVTDASGNTRTCVYTVSVTNNLSSTVSGTFIVQVNSPAPNVTFTGTGGTKPYTFTYTVNGGPAQTVSTTGNNSSVTVAQSTSTVGEFVYTLVGITDSYGCSGTLPADPRDTITVLTVVPRPDLYSSVDEPLNSTFSNGDVQEGYVTIANASTDPTTGQVTFSIYKPVNFTLELLSSTTTSAGTAVNNTDWDITSTPFTYILKSKPGVVIEGNGSSKVGFKLTATGNANSSYIMTISINNGTGGSTPTNGDSNNTNNQSVNLFIIN